MREVGGSGDGETKSIDCLNVTRPVMGVESARADLNCGDGWCRLAVMRAFGFGVSGGAKRDASPAKAGDGNGKFGRGRADMVWTQGL